MQNAILFIIIGVILLCISWALRRADAPATPPIIRWICDVLGAILLVLGIILVILSLLHIATPLG